MPATGKPALAIASYDWSDTTLGNPSGWPAPLRLAAAVLLNSPAPMLLAWGQGPVVLFNEAYAALDGGSRAPGGSVPALMPPPLAAAPAAWDRAWHGEAGFEAGAALWFAQSGAEGPRSFDLYFTPLEGEDGAPQGVLCTLAAAADAAAVDTAAADTAAVDTAPAGPLRILVVEDNLDSQYLVCEMLKAFGHQAEGVAHPADALAQLARQRFDVLFSDLSLPGMSGVELARQALRDAPWLKVIFASGYGDTLLRHLEFPYQSLQKPYELDQLQDALERVVRDGAGRA